ncbi:hypothetical protein ACO0SA_004042 [Hanseniaspora valbyensis]
MSAIFTKLSNYAKKVYVTEGLAPPSVAQFKQVYRLSFDTLKAASKNSDKVHDKLTKITAKQWIYYTLGAAQVAGFFAIGESLGRGKFIGYPIYLPEHHDEHH